MRRAAFPSGGLLAGAFLLWPAVATAQYEAAIGLDPCPAIGHLLDCSGPACGLGDVLASLGLDAATLATATADADDACAHAGARERGDALAALAQVRLDLAGHATAAVIDGTVGPAETAVGRLPSVDVAGTWLGTVPILQGGGGLRP